MIKDRRALITGSAHGIGAGIARRLATDGWTVCINDIDVQAVDTLVDELNNQGFSAASAIADATDETSVTEMISRLELVVGHIGAVILNATGPQPDRSLADTGWSEMADELDFFVKSPNIVSHAVLPRMREQKQGRIVHIDSEVATKMVSERTNYITAKNAQIALAKSWALEVASEGITVNTVAPGFVPVERHSRLSRSDIESYRSTVPMKRMGTIDDIAAAVAFLLSDDASFITGQRIVVDGGRHLI